MTTRFKRGDHVRGYTVRATPLPVDGNLRARVVGVSRDSHGTHVWVSPITGVRTWKSQVGHSMAHRAAIHRWR